MNKCKKFHKEILIIPDVIKISTEDHNKSSVYSDCVMYAIIIAPKVKKNDKKPNKILYFINLIIEIIYYESK